LLKYIKSSTLYEIEFIDTIEKEDLRVLRELLSEEIIFFKLYCRGFYTLPLEFVDTLYLYQEKHKKKIEVIVSHNKLSKYLHKLGFKSIFHLDDMYKHKKELSPDILVIGGSSNSSEKIIQILSSIDMEELSVFIVQHISPKLGSYFDDVLSSYVQANVHYAIDGELIKKSSIYIAPKDKHLLVKNGCIELSDAPSYHSARPSISLTFSSLSREYASRLLAILSCGNESDGVDSLSVLHSNNSTILLQEAKECNADSIPTLAKRQKIYDYILSTKDLISYIKIISLKFSKNDDYIVYLLEMIQVRYEYDFRDYNRDSLMRRIDQFMIQHRIATLKELLIVVSFNETIFNSLFLSFSINITDFFRKGESSDKMIELIEKEHKNCYNIKIWSAGCSNGKEAYSTAIILQEMGLLHKSIIYATDINAVIIEEAKNGLYCLDSYEKALCSYEHFDFRSPLSDYFIINNNYVKIIDSIKKNILFFVHNLEKDSVFNEFSIIECKNVMIYFDDQLKERVFQLFYDSLEFGGHLLLGESEEMLPSFLNRFEQCQENCKVYMKVA